MIVGLAWGSRALLSLQNPTPSSPNPKHILLFHLFPLSPGHSALSLCSWRWCWSDRGLWVFFLFVKCFRVTGPVLAYDSLFFCLLGPVPPPVAWIFICRSHGLVTVLLGALCFALVTYVLVFVMTVASFWSGAGPLGFSLIKMRSAQYNAPLLPLLGGLMLDSSIWLGLCML
jgi:hypothetical protein